MPTSSRDSTARRSSPATRGSPIGGATRSSRCAVSVSPAAGSTRRARSCSRGRRRSRRACCRTASPTTARRPSSTPSMPRSGTSSPCTNSWRRRGCSATETKALQTAVDAILAGYAAGTRYGIGCDADGLLRAGEAGVQLTWMDAKVGDWVVTPRIGKPVEVQALWLNALWVGSQRSERWADLLARGRTAFAARFWNEARGCLFDVIDCDHQAGTSDADAAPESDPRRRRTAAGAGRPQARAQHRRRGREAALDAARPAVAGAVRAWLHAALSGRRAHARRRVSPGNSVAVAARRVRRRLGARAQRHAGREARGAQALPRLHCSPISTRPVWATSARSPTATRRTLLAVAPSRPGRSAKRCASTRSY